MTRWMLLALLACASAQDVDRLQQATRALEKAAKESGSPVLAALALKSATSSGGSALTKVIKFIDEAYNNIQDQIEKETAAHTECVNLTTESDHTLHKLNRDRMGFEAAVSTAQTKKADAKQARKDFQSQKDDNQNARSAAYNTFQNTKNNFDGELDHLQHNLDQLKNIEDALNAQVANAKEEQKKKNLNKAVDLFETLTARVGEQMDTVKGDLKAASKEYQEYTEEDDRQMKNIKSGLERQTSKQKQAGVDEKDNQKSLLATMQKLKTAETLRKDIDAQCVKTTVNHEDRAKQRQSEIDSLKQVKEILSQ